MCIVPLITTPHYIGPEVKFIQGSGRIHLHNVNCTGSETKLVDCGSDMNPSGCTHDQDLGVRCQSCE